MIAPITPQFNRFAGVANAESRLKASHYVRSEALIWMGCQVLGKGAERERGEEQRCHVNCAGWWTAASSWRRSCR